MLVLDNEKLSINEVLEIVLVLELLPVQASSFNTLSLQFANEQVKKSLCQV